MNDWMASHNGWMWLIIGSIVAYSLFASVRLVRSLRRQRIPVDQVVAKFGGKVTRSTGSSTRVEFTFEDIPVVVLFRSSIGNTFTRVWFKWFPPGSLRLTPEDFLTPLVKPRGTVDLQLGDPVFDRRFLIQGKPEAWVRRVLSPETRSLILSMSEIGRTLLGRRSLSIEVGPPGVSVAVAPDLYFDPLTLQRFLGSSIRLLRHFRSAPDSRGVDILTADACAEAGQCPVCANAMEADVHACPGCATPHHAECWNYFGGCAMYACGHRQPV